MVKELVDDKSKGGWQRVGWQHCSWMARHKRVCRAEKDRKLSKLVTIHSVKKKSCKARTQEQWTTPTFTLSTLLPLCPCFARLFFALWLRRGILVIIIGVFSLHNNALQQTDRFFHKRSKLETSYVSQRGIVCVNQTSSLVQAHFVRCEIHSVQYVLQIVNTCLLSMAPAALLWLDVYL